VDRMGQPGGRANRKRNSRCGTIAKNSNGLQFSPGGQTSGLFCAQTKPNAFRGLLHRSLRIGSMELCNL
jgi:hypothetical protein